MKSYGSNFFYKTYSNIGYNIKHNISKHKIAYIVCLVIMLIAILTGVFTAIKQNDYVCVLGFGDNYVVKYLDGDLGSWELFFTRLWSCIVCMCFISVCNLTTFLFPISFLFCVYRAYLIGLNIALLVIIFGFSAIISGAVIILPCHLFTLLVICIYFYNTYNRAKEKKRFGFCNSGKMNGFILFFIYLIIIIIINLIETLLLSLICTQINLSI